MSRGLIAGLRHCLDFLGTASGVVKSLPSVTSKKGLRVQRKYSHMTKGPVKIP